MLEEFCAANKVSDNDEVSSTGGYVFTLDRGVILWKSVKHTCIARPTMEAKFITTELAGQDRMAERSINRYAAVGEKTYYYFPLL